MWRNVSARHVVRRSRRAALTSLVLLPRISVWSTPSGHERLNRSNFPLAANSELLSPAESSDENTEPTCCPAATCTVRGTRRSSFQVTPCPPDSRSMRRLVTMPVWLGSVLVISTSLRALNVVAPSSTIRWKVGAPDLPSWVIASGFSPSTEITTTRVTWFSATTAVRGSGGGAAGAGAAAISTETSAVASAEGRTRMGQQVTG